MRCINWLLLLFCLIGCSANNANTEILSWMIKESGIKIPPDAQQISMSPLDYGKIYKFSLSPASVSSFIKENSLTAVDPDAIQMILIEDVEEQWFDQIKNKGEFYYRSDCKPGLVWHVLANSRTNEVWFEMLHADHGGDLPECEK